MPDRVNDAILSNLLPVTDLPLTVWSAPTDARLPKDVWSVVENSPPFILRDKRLYTFADLGHPQTPFNPVIHRKEIRGDPVSAWRNDSAKWSWFIDLMHRALHGHLGKMGIKPSKGRRYFFVGGRDGDSRTHRNASDTPREVAAKKVNSIDGSIFWVHHGASLRFMTLGENVYLCIEPCYVFTSDGRMPLTGPRVTPLSMKWGGKERNAAILRHLMFWARTAGRGKPVIELDTGGAEIVISGIPALSRTMFGIEFDHIALKTLMAQMDGELDEVAKSVEGVSFGGDRSDINEDDDDE